MKNIIIKIIPEGESTFDFPVKDTLNLVLVMTKQSSSRVQVRLVKTGAQATIIGLAVGNDRRSIALHTDQIHEAPGTMSNLLVKGVFRDHARFIYDGEIRVEREAQGTDAYQRNENLLLSRDAFVESKPELEILANSVRCTHGAATSSISKDHLWYLSTRGIKKDDATKLIVKGFLESALDKIADTEAKEKIFQTVEEEI